MNIVKTKPFLVSLFFLFLGIFSIAMENIFYGYIDKDGVLRESFFLPVGTASFLLGAAGLIVSIILYYLSAPEYLDTAAGQHMDSPKVQIFSRSL